MEKYLELISPAIVIAVLLGLYGLIKMRQAGENITQQHERRAFEALVARNQRHAAEKAREKALDSIGPYLRRELKDYKNLTRPGSGVKP